METFSQLINIGACLDQIYFSDAAFSGQKKLVKISDFIVFWSGWGIFTWKHGESFEINGSSFPAALSYCIFFHQRI